VLILTAADLARALPMSEAISSMEETFRLADGETQIPVRTRIPLTTRAGTFLIMPALVESIEVLGTKIASVIPGNARSELEPVQAFYSLISAVDGRLLAIMEGIYLTAVRTAATSALATRLMSRAVPARLCVFGTGTQARYHLEAISSVREIIEARVCGSSPERSAEFARLQGACYPFPIRPATSAAAVEEADIICTCTNSPEPVFEGGHLKAGAHINAIGAYRPETREVDDKTMKRARVVVDSLTGAMAEAGDILIPFRSGILRREQIVGDLSEIVRGVSPGRASEEEITVFKSVGFALEDLGAGLRAYNNALRLGLGTKIELKNQSGIP
jgi:ornithine cyclodeaminase/alanine dehydrogenase-like protein (mu-crystallin family)